MDILHDILDALRGARVRDVHATGYLERDYGPPHFVPSGGTVYLDLGDQFLCIDGAREEGALTLRLSTEITVPPVLVDDDDEFITASIGRLLFDWSTPQPLIRVRYAVSDPIAAAERGVVRCAEFQLGVETGLFFDPMTVEQLRLAASTGYSEWQRTDRARDIEVHGSVAEYVWDPDRGLTTR